MFDPGMRASRLLQILLILQNRGRQTSRELAEELEVAPRTILRDVDALTEAGLPIIVFQGNRGGIELGFNYRTRLTGLAKDEAEALGVLLAAPNRAIEDLGMSGPARRAMAKLIESFPDLVRGHIAEAQGRFAVQSAAEPEIDPRVAAIADAIREARIVTLRARDSDRQQIHPVRLSLDGQEWSVTCALCPDDPIAQPSWRDLNISNRRFTRLDAVP